MPVLDLFRIDGRAALITGGNRGLGRAMAQAFAEAGASVAVTSREADRAEEAAVEIAESTGQKCMGLPLDVRDGGSVAAAVQQATSELGGLDILVNNAGINIREPIADLKDESWHDIIETNLSGAMRCSRAVVGGMKAKGWGRIINIGSILSFIGIPERTSYASSKAGILGMTRAMALDLAPHGVTVNALCPGVFKTEINRPILNDPDYLEEFLKQIPMGAMGDPAQLMGAAVFLASEASSYMTGAALLIDGGWTVK